MRTPTTATRDFASAVATGFFIVALIGLLARCAPAHASPADAGSDIGSDSAAALHLPSAGQLPDPAESPIAAIDDVRLLARTGWAATVFGCLLMLTKLAAYLSASSLQNVPVLGAVAAWLAVGRRTVIVSGLGTVAAAGYNAVLLGGSWAAAAVAAGVALAGLVTPSTVPRKAVA